VQSSGLQARAKGEGRRAKGEGRRAKGAAYAWEMLVRLTMRSGSLVMRLPSHHLCPNDKQCRATQPPAALLQQSYTRGRHVQGLQL
jgi:hypothetical protein